MSQFRASSSGWLGSGPARLAAGFIQVPGFFSAANLAVMSDEAEWPESLMLEEIQPEAWLSREVFARFGLAMYSAQTLEHEIVNLIVWTGIRSGDYTTAEQMETANAVLFKKTLGRLKRELLGHRIDLSHLESDLIRAVELRNFLAHSYFRERAGAFMTHDGKEQMLTELDDATTFFEKVDSALTPFTRRIIDEYGLMDKIPELMAAPESREFGHPLPGIS